ncbi:MAG: hypothetical protein JEZ08_16495 [Clostridiales bacterium]|nr:hypothetical protein [Clostridiales bacterium]
MINTISLLATASNGGGWMEFINQYSDYLGLASLLLVGLIVFIIYYIKENLFSNTSKVTEMDLNTVKTAPSQDLINIDDIGQNMFISHETGTHTGVLETTGIPYRILSEQEKDGVNSGYIGFLNAMNFSFSKHIMSRKIDIEKTENIYSDAYNQKKDQLERYIERSGVIEKRLSDVSEDDLLHEEYAKLQKEILLHEKHLVYLEAQMDYLDTTTSRISGSTKSVYYATSAELDAEALKGLEPTEEVYAYANNVGDKTIAMMNSLANIGVKSKVLDDVELLDLARTHYKPSTSNKFKTKHLVNESNIDADTLLNIEIYGRIKLLEALKKEAANGSEN